MSLRTDWTRAEVTALFDLPFTELVFRAAAVHREHHAPGELQLCTLLSIKTGGCPEDCGYCSQSAFADTGLKAEKLMDVDAVLTAAAEAKAAGSQRFCMGAAWRSPEDRDNEVIRVVAAPRIAMPLSMVRLSAGRESMSEATQSLCFMAGANSIFTGDKLLTTGNVGDSAGAAMFAKLGLVPMVGEEPMRTTSSSC